MRVGSLKHRIQVQEKKQTQDPNTGDMVESWVDVKKIWAATNPLSARDFIAANAAQTEVSARLTIRADYSLNESMRMIYIKRNIVYTIVGILPDPDSGEEYMTVLVGSGVRVAP